MRKPALFVCVGVLMVSLAAVAADKKSSSPADPVAARDQKISAAVEAMRDRLVAQRRDFHMHPELSNREVRTSGIVAERLRAIGFTEVRTGIARYGVLAVLRGGKPGPVIAVRADMDALPIQEVNDVPYKSLTPGVKHACGHDLHTTVELGVAEILWSMREQIPGTIVFLFQPAEESAPEGEEGGATLMLKEGAFKDPKPEVIFGLHTYPQLEAGYLGYTPGSALASSERFLVKVRGKQAHGSQPQDGIDAVEVSAQIINSLQTVVSRRIRALDAAVVTVGKINGGVRFNVIAPEVEMDGTVRSLKEDVRLQVHKYMQEIIEGVAKANGATAQLTWGDKPNLVTYNDPKLVEETLPIMRKVLGEAYVIHTDPSMGAEDFSWYQKEIPGFYYFLGVGNKARGITAGWHTPDFDVDEKSLEVGVRVMSNVLLDYLDRHSQSSAAPMPHSKKKP
ncbi:MAG: amidohydrolase [Acidobacteriales bacterium]|nr:amidohydrolase [Terriglobales bacterium]